MSVFNILIVEDELIAALALQDTLEQSGFKVTALATSESEALAAIKAEFPDLVLMDIHLNENEDGIAVGKKILEEYKLPVVFITAFADRETIARAREVFPYGYIVKPWQEGELLAVLETALFKHLADKRAHELHETRNKFFSIIGHDLRSPLAALSLTTRTLTKHLGSLSKEEIGEFIEDIHATVESLYAFTDNMLEWAKIQSSRLEVQPQHFYLADLVEEVKGLIHGKALNKKVGLQLEVEPGLMLKADRNMTRSILLNLISNGVKFSYAGSSVQLTARKASGMACVEVRDFGVGMSPSQLDQLLKNSHMVPTPGTDHEKGSGLGLLLCKEFVALNGGSFSIKSQLQEGTSINLELPLA